MGPKTMLALIAWSVASGPFWDGNDEMSCMWSLDGNVAHLLHGTLAAMGLSPGPEEQLLGPQSVTALDRWDGTFRVAGILIPIDEDAGRQIVMNDFGEAGNPSPDAKETTLAGDAPATEPSTSASATGEQWGAWTRWIAEHTNVGGATHP